MLGVGGATAVVGHAGDDTPSATSTGVGGGVVSVQTANSTTTANPTVTTEIMGGSSLNGLDVVVAGASQANAAANGSNTGGGLVSVGAANSTVNITNKVTSELDATATINALQDVQIVATSVEAPSVGAQVSGGGLVATAHIDATATTAHTTLAKALGNITAGRTVLIEGREGFSGSGVASSFAGGLGVSTHADVTTSIGAQDGTNNQNCSLTSTTCAVTGAVLDGTIHALTIYASGQVGGEHTIDANTGDVISGDLPVSDTPVQVTGVVITSRAATQSDAFGAGSDASSTVNDDEIAGVDLGSSALLFGNTTEFHARAENQAFNIDSNADCSCFAGESTANSNLNYYGVSRVTGEAGSVIHTAALWVDVFQDVSPNLTQDAHGGFLVSHNGGNNYNGNSNGCDNSANNWCDLTQTRDINWNSTVFLLGDPNPVLTINSAGIITAKSPNVTVSTSPDLSNPLSVNNTSDPISSGQTIYVGPILYKDLPEALFEANSRNSNNISTIESSNGSANTPAQFIMQDSWDSVIITNEADNPMVMEGTGGPSSLSIETTNEALTSNPDAVIDISVDKGAKGDSDFQFGVLNAFIPTIVTVQSIRGPPLGGPTTGFPVTFGGGIDNIIGTTTLQNDRGDIVVGTATGDTAGTAATYTFRSNQLHLIATDGSVGCATNDPSCASSYPLNAQLIQYGTGVNATPTVQPIVLDGTAYDDFHLTLQTVRRDGSTPATATIAPVIGPLNAGRDIVIQVLPSLAGNDQGDVGRVLVNSFTPNNLPQTPFTAQNGAGPHDTQSVIRHYWPDLSGAAVGVCWSSTNCTAGTLDSFILTAYGTTTATVNSDYTFTDPSSVDAPGLSAGHDIYVHYGSEQAPDTTSEVTFKVFTDVDAPFSDATGAVPSDDHGRIDLYTNGSITDFETSGDLRAGQIISSGECTSAALCPSTIAADAILNSPAAVLDAGKGVDTPTAQETPTAAQTNVIARNITISAGDNLLGLPSSRSGLGGVGTPDDFLLVQVNADGPDKSGNGGLLSVTDTAATRVLAALGSNEPPAGGGTYGAFITQTNDNGSNGNMDVNTVTTNGDASLTTTGGSILDARDFGSGDNSLIPAPNVIADNVDLSTTNGSVGASGDPLKVFSSANHQPAGGAQCTRSFTYGYQAGYGDAGSAERTVSATCHLAAQADNSIFITETSGSIGVAAPADVLLLLARNGDVQLTTTETQVDGAGRATLSAALSTSGPITSLAVSALATPLPKGAPIVVSDGANTQTFITSAAVAAGATSIPIVSATPNFAYETTSTVIVPATAGNDILLLNGGTTLVIENTPETVDFGTVDAENGNVTLRSADDVVTDAGSVIAATTAPNDTHPGNGGDPNQPQDQTGNIDIYGDSHPGLADASTGDGTVMVLRGTIAPGLGITSDDSGLTRVFGNEDADSITFDQTILSGNTRAYGSDAPTAPGTFAPAGDGEDTFTAYKLQSMTPGQALTLDGQDGTDHYVIWTHGTQGASTSYVINVLDSGAPDSGADTLDVYGADSSQNGIDPSTGNPYPTDDIFLLRAASYLVDSSGDESGARPSVYCGQTSPTAACANQPAYVALLHPGGLVPGEDALTAVEQSDYAGVVERINYDNAVNGRLGVYGLGGNDYFAVDDNAATTTLDGGAGNDTFQIGQMYGMRRDAVYSGLQPQDYFPTIATTRGYLSRGTSEPLVAEGGSGDDTFQVYSNQAALRLEGDDGNDQFLVQAFALAETFGGPQSPAGNSTNQGDLVMGQLFTGSVTLTTGSTATACAANQATSACATITRNDSGSFLTDGFRVGQTLVMSGSGTADDNNAGTAHVITAISSDGKTLTLDALVPVAGTFGSVSLSPGPLTKTPLSVAGSGANAGTITRSDGGGSFITDGFVTGQTIAIAGTGTADDNLTGLPYTITNVTATTIAFTVQSATPGQPNPLVGGTFAGATVTAVLPTPLLTSGFSTAAQTDVRTGNGDNQVEYNVNAPVSVDGGSGFNKLVVLGTEFADHIVVTNQGVFGAGLEVTYQNIQVLEVDALEGDDTIDVLSTPANMAVQVIGGLGSDTINVAGDVVGDVTAKDINGSSSTINHLVTSDDPNYNNIVAPGLNVDVARATQGNVIVTESGGSTDVRRGGSCALTSRSAARWTATRSCSPTSRRRTST